MYTVKKLARLAGITPRALHYYDQIGLLKPTQVGANGYRYYGEQALLRLQQILLYRELDLPLEAIQRILGEKDFNAKAALKSHKQALRRRIAHLERIVTTVEDTILHLEGKKPMTERQLFEAFSEEQQAEYEKEAMQLYDPEIVKASNKKWKSYTAADKQRILEEGNAAYQAFLDAMPQGPTSAQAQAAVQTWRKHMDYFWTPDPSQLLALARSYNSDPRFKANFDKLHPGLAAFVLAAVEVVVGAG